jgi:hypothetical protein
MTENWQATLSTPDAVHQVMDGMDGRLGLCLDFGNWSGPDKHTALSEIAPYAISCHAKCSFDADLQPDLDDYQHCLEMTRSLGFDGSYTLIYDGPNDDEWAGLQREMDMVRPYLG